MRARPQDGTLHGLVSRVAASMRDALALADETRTLSFGDLEARSTAFAELLVERGIVRGDIVALLLPRSVDAVVAMLGVMKAGAAYLPVDPELPEERIRYMVEDSGARALVAARAATGGLAPVMLSFAEAPATPRGNVALPQVASTDLAYVIYTSGSTGLPKGVCIEHVTICALAREQGQAKSVSGGARHSQFASLSFDAHVWEIWPALTGGASVHFVPDAVRMDPQGYIAWIARERIDWAFLPTPVGEEYLRAEWPACSLKGLGLGGDTMHALPARPYGFEVVNVYGPTECTCVATTSIVRPGEERPSIGRPIGGVRVYILDEKLVPVASGEVGELYVAGALVGRGYLRRPELTASSFTPDPFASEPGARMYRTGDLARLRPDGTLDCLGRIDFQVKIRGYRIELGEIEARLGAASGVRDAVVVAREDVPGDKRLAAYLVASDGATLDLDALESDLRRSLPEYMVPSAFVALASLPLTTNGKVDRKALPAPDYASAVADYVAPRDAVEEVLAHIFRDVLRLERAGIHDDFFALGGHSLRATQVAARVRGAFSVDLPVRALFEAPTVAALAEVVRSAARSAGLEPIVRVDRTGSSPASFAQARLWFLDQMDPGTATYNVATAHRLEGNLDPVALERSLQALVDRHEALRTTFVAVDGAPHQVVHEALELTLQRIEATSEDAARAQISREVHAPFDLARGPLLRATLVRLGATTHVLVLCMHHIATDGWSMEVLVRELSAHYAAFAAGGQSALAPLAVDYVDFSAWQRSRLANGGTLARQLAFWKDHLAGAPTALELPTDRPRPATKQHRGGTVPFVIPTRLVDRLYALCRRDGATPFMVLLAAYQALLSRWSGQEDVVVGTPIANRTHQELESIVGFFVNTLPLRTSLGENPSFRELVGRVKRAALSAYAHQDVPFEKLVDELRIARDTSRTPVFQAMFAMQNTFQETRALGGLRVSVEPADVDVAKFDLTLVTSEREGKLLGVLEYDAALFDRSTIERFSSHFLVLLDAALHAPEAALATLPLMDEAETRRVLVEWNATSRPFDESPVHEAFARRAAERPDAVAVACEVRQLTYGELNRRANRLARALVRRGVRPGHVVATLLRRSELMIVAQLAVLKAGAAYAPLDPSHPPARLAFFVADVGARLLLSTRDVSAEVDAGIEVMALDEPTSGSELASERDDDLGVPCRSRDIAYVIYTSGSTGEPKGAAVAHRSLANLVDHYRGLLALGPTDRISQIASPAFDGTMNEIWPALTSGATLDIADDQARQSPFDLARWLRDRGVTIAYTTTPMAELLLDEDWSGASLRALTTGGQALRRRPRGHEPFRLVNIYGPTEATDYVTCEDVEPGDHPVTTIGRPIQNTAIYILDANERPAPIGVYGELHIGGANVARGYVGRPALTAERFLPDPFAAAPGARLYRTGDRARWLPDGRIEFGGRNDDQVKIRGYRIELGEIESVLSRVDGVREAVVLAREDTPGDRQLVAYTVVAAGASVATDALNAALAAVLPGYMMPSAFVALDALPRTPNGKIDRKALPAPDFAAASNAYVAPRDAVEEALAEIFRDVLRLERVGIHDDFFVLGGHSLRATQVVSRARTMLEVVLPVRALFEAPTVATLAARVRAASSAATSTPLARVDRSLPLPASFAQTRLWFLDQLDPGTATYNVPMLLELVGPLDAGALARALRKLVARHEALRTTFVAIDGMPHQVIHPSVDLELRVRDVTSEDDARAQIFAEIHAPFDLARGPLVRAALLRVSKAKHVLVVCVHHVATDGWAMEILAKELTALYPAFAAGRPSPLAPVRVDYADFAAWQRSWLTDAEVAKQLAFWKEHLAGAPAALELPADRARPPMKQYRGGNVHFTVPRELAERVHAFCRREGATPFMVLLAAYQALLSRWSGQDDIVVGTPIANRTRHELEGIVGFFVNTLALRSSLAGAPSFEELVRHVKRTALAAYNHQDVPFERLVEELRVARDTSRAPVFQAIFLMQNVTLEALALGDVAVRRRPPSFEIAKFDLTLGFVEQDGGFWGELKYDVAIFDRATIERFASHFLVLLEAAIAAPATSAATLPLMSRAEREQVRAFSRGAPLRDLAQETAAVRFERQAARSPDAAALRAGGLVVTYAELEARANRLARVLRLRGIGRGSRVVTLFDRSIEMVVALLATLKAGAAYVPADPAYPAERVAHMIADSGAVLAVTTCGLAKAARLEGAICLDDRSVTEEIAAQADTRLPVTTSMLDEAYVIFTSGTTGKPKGTIIAHEQLAALVAWHVAAFDVTAGDRAAQIAGVAFDATVWELWPYLLTGTSVAIPDDETRMSAERLRDWFIAERTTIAFAATPLAELLLGLDWPKDAPLRILLTGGDRLSRRPRAGLPFTLVNNYGPTECTVVSTSGVVAPQGAEASTSSPALGRPVHGTQNHVLDDRLEPVPIGVAGQLWIGGACVGSGYASRPELTVERFLPDPFSERAGARMYATGDLVRWARSGELEYLGRIDHQVKIRGFRIELGEVEAALAGCEDVREAVVVAHGHASAEKRLVAYLCPRRTGTLDVESLKTALMAKLPPYMVPSAFIVVDALPLTPNGKVDRKALPVPDASAGAAEYVAPRDAVEETLAGIFRDVLGVERVGIHDDFFALGGHSLRATQVVSRLRTLLGVELPVRCLFEAPTVAALAEHVRAAAGASPTEALVRVDRSRAIPASFAQSRLWFLDQLEPDSPTYNVPITLHLEGPLDVGALERSLQELVARHEALRTSFVSVDGELQQIVAPSVELRLRRTSATSDEEARAQLSSDAHAPFDLAHGPLVRAALARRSATSHVLLLCIHHIATDGWSMEVLVRELSALYLAFSAGEASPLEPVAVDYADYSVWQRSWLSGGLLAKQVAFWREHLAGAPAALELPADRARPPTKQYRGRSVPFAIGHDVAERLHALCRRQGATPFMVLLAAYQSLLSRWSGQADVVVGTPIANRTRRDLESIVGFFVNTLALRTSFEGDPSFEEIVERVKRSALGAYSHQDVPFERLVDELRISRDTSRTPVFQAMFSMQNLRHDAIRLGDVSVRREPTRLDVSKVDISLGVIQDGTTFEGAVELDVALFDVATMQRFASHFLVLLDAALASPGTSVARLPLMDEAERRRVLLDWNATTHAIAGPRTVQEVFEAQVDRTPGAAAVECSGVRLSYAELDARANRIAHALLASGVSREERVAVELDRSVDMLAAMIGVMKAGAAYLPIDPQLPDDRRAYMKEDANVVTTLDAAAVTEILLSSSAARPNARIAPEQLAYVLYTSGSTGRPKGTMVSHANVTNLLASMVREPGISAEDTTLSLTTISFDVSVAELFLPLVVGAKVVIGSREEARDPRLIAALIEATGARQFGATPATWRMMVDSGWRPRAGMEIHCAGEALPRDLADALLENGASLWNLYGPTEATVYASGIEVRRNERITIGRPLDNTQLYVLDAHLQAVPTGVLGELYIGGAGVARGYLGRAELTAEKFVPDPFSPHLGARMYRTGDVVRWLAGGTLEYLGRLDHQVKIRGFRIELGEIEAALANVPGIERAVTLAREDVPGDKRLVAYVVPTAGTSVETEALKSALALTLPGYMIPSAFVVLASLPLNASGKIDRKALPAPQFAGSEAAYVAPRTPTEHAIAAIFRELLRIDRVGVHDDFFSLGGHSLMATRVMTRIRERLDASLPVRAMFAAPTVAQLAERVEQLKGGSSGPRLECAPDQQRAPLSYNQRFWWRRQQNRPDSPGYKYLQAYRIRGPLDEEALGRSVDEETRRHSALRTIFAIEDGEPVQLVREPREGCLARVTLAGAKLEAVGEWLREESDRRPDLLGGAPFPRFTLLRLAEGEHVLVITGHRITFDPMLCANLVADLLAIYDAFTRNAPSPLVEPAFQYVDFVAWQRKVTEAPELVARLTRARAQLAGATPLALPVDREQSATYTTSTHRDAVVMDGSVWTAVGELARAESTTQFVVLSAVFKAFLSRLTAQSDVTIIAPNELARGLDASLSSVFGCFHDYFILRTDLSGSPSLRELVRREHAVVLSAQRDIDVPSALVTDDYVDNPLWRVALNYVPAAGDGSLAPPSVTTVTLEAMAAPRHRMVDLAWAVFGASGWLFGAADLFDAATVARLAADFSSFLAQALDAPDAALGGGSLPPA